MFECEECGKRFGRKHAWKEHTEGIHEGVVYSCELCDFKTIIRRELRPHREAEHEGIRFQCFICKMYRKKRWPVENHIKEAHITVKFEHSLVKRIVINQDDIENSSGKWDRNLKVTNQEQQSRVRYQCYLCDSKLRSFYNFPRHFKNVHPFDSIDKDKVVKINLEKFDQLTKWDLDLNVTDQELKRRIRYKCNLCDSQIRSFYNLTRHFEKVHSADLFDAEKIERVYLEKPEPLIKWDQRSKIDDPQMRSRIRYQCYLCDAKLKSIYNIPRHFQKAHVNEIFIKENVKEVIIDEEEHEVNDYKKEKKKKEKLTSKSNTHAGKFFCYLCNKDFITSNSNFTKKLNIFMHFGNLHPEEKLDYCRITSAKNHEDNSINQKEEKVSKAREENESKCKRKAKIVKCKLCHANILSNNIARHLKKLHSSGKLLNDKLNNEETAISNSAVDNNTGNSDVKQEIKEETMQGSETNDNSKPGEFLFGIWST